MSCCGPSENNCSNNENLQVTSEQQELSKICKALGHEVRVQILEYLNEQDGCITTDFVNILPLAQSTISQHLKVLKDANLIDNTCFGKKNSYCVNKATLKKFRALVVSL
jgi:ArsR family transcriptional regulator